MNRLLTFMTGLVLLSVFSAAQAVTDTYTASGTWTAPAGVTSVDVEAWGGGAAGGGNPTNNDGGGGGGGGAYSKTTAIPVVPGTVYTVTVGAAGIGGTGSGGDGGDSWFSTAATILAKGGTGGAPPVGGAGGVAGTGGAAAAGIGAIKFSGGNGGTGRNSNTGRGGPGGSSAGTAANGTSGPVVWATATAAAPPAGGGIGGNGGNANRQNGFVPASGNGGGGGGGAERSTLGGDGTVGKVAITYTPPPAVTSINRFDPDPTTLASIRWTVIFNTSVTGVASGNFTLVNSGLGGAPAITSVSGAGTTWTVTASTGTGTGTLGLNMTNTTGITPALTGLPFTGQVYSVRPPASVTYYHDTTTGVPIGVDGPTNVVSGSNVTIPPIITASLTLANTCTGSARSRNHPTGPYTHSRWYLNADYAAATIIGANPSGSARLRGRAATDTVVVSLYDYDPVSGVKVLIGSSPAFTITAGTANYPYTITSPLYTVPANHRLMLQYDFNQATTNSNARVYCSSTAAFISVTEIPVPTALVAEYRMDEESWNGTANEVADSGTNALHGSAQLGATPATAKICNGANLLANYVEVPYNALLDLPTALTVTAWIKPARWGGVPGKDALMSILSKDTNFEAHVNATGNVNWWWGTGSITSTATAPVGAWTHVAMVYASGSQTLYINGVASGTGTVAGALPTNALPFQIGDDQAFGGGTRRFDGMIDEVKIFNSALTPTEISTGYANENAGNNWDGSARVCAPLDHVAIDAPPNAIVFSPDPVVIAPHTAGHGAVANGDTINLSTSTGLGDWTIGTGTGILTPGMANSGLATYTFGAGENSVSLDFSYPAAGAVTINVTDSLGADLLLYTPAGELANTITYTVPGFVFTDSACVHNIAFGAPGQTCAIPSWSPQVAGQDVSNVYLTAVNAAGVPRRLSRTRNRTRNMRFGLSCHDPVAHAGIQATFGAATLPLCEANGAMPTAWSATLAAFFPAGIPSAGPYIFNYADVGAVNLWMQNSATPTQIGSSGQFVVKPDHFDISNVVGTVGSVANPAATGAAGAKFIKAGDAFSVTVTAMNAAGVPTPNYGRETVAQGVRLIQTIVTPAGGNNPPLTIAATGTTNDVIAGIEFGATGQVATDANGVATVTNLGWNEVGIISLDAVADNAGANDYLGTGSVTGATTGTTGNIGRFYAAQFALSGGVIANRTDICAAPAGCSDTFTYMGEEMGAVFALTAKAVDGAMTLTNYATANGFAKLDPTAAGNPLALGAVDTGTPRTVATLDTATYGVASGSFAGGIAFVTAPFAVTRGGSASAPFDALDVGVNPADSDGAALAVLDLAVNAGGSPNTHGKVGTTKARYGLMKLSNAHGSELLPLTIAVTAQYWNGTTYVTNTLDNNSTFAATDVVFSNYQENLAAGEASVVTPPASVTFANGTADFRLAAPGTGKNGSVDMTVNIISAYLPGNTARATFGVYKGNNEFIYLRESY